jgi:uncharacterized protein (TIGR03118 family)
MNGLKMHSRRLRRSLVAGGAALSLAGVLAAGSGVMAGASGNGVYRQTNLVSDIPGVARTTDLNLVNPWGMSELPGSPLWVSDNNANVSTLYVGDQNGSPLVPAPVPTPPTGPLVVSIPDGAPTGQAANTTTQFVVKNGTDSGPALFLFASENGDITGWAPNVPAPKPPNKVSTDAQVAFQDANAVYKGLAIDTSNMNAPQLFAANFSEARIDVFDGAFKLQSHPGLFMDKDIPAGYAPFNVAVLADKLYVTYAVQNAQKHDDVAGPGNGFVDVYDLHGKLLQQLVKHGDLNSPWGLVIATDEFGRFSNDLLVGNFGMTKTDRAEGSIHAYDLRTGKLKGTLTNPDGLPIQIEGLWGLLFGDKSAGTPNTLFFAAGIAAETHGLLGTLTPGED